MRQQDPFRVFFDDCNKALVRLTWSEHNIKAARRMARDIERATKKYEASYAKLAPYERWETIEKVAYERPDRND